MWLGFVLSAGLIASFVTRMGAVLREQEQRLAQAREQSLRDERLLALGALAAGAAHELGTPLATMGVVTDELVSDCGPDSALGRRLGIVRGQIERCKKVLAELAERAGEQPAAAGHKQRLVEYLDDLIRAWQREHPAVHCAVDWRGPRPGPWIVADLTLDQALRNLLTNAADASPWRVDVAGQWDEDSLRLQICDQGPGFNPAALPQAGRAVFSTKARGRGLGLLLAQSTLTRFGGQIAFGNRAEGGACVTVLLPLAQIRITHDAS
jgi:two-component system sensor histidine kinase RegB